MLIRESRVVTPTWRHTPTKLTSRYCPTLFHFSLLVPPPSLRLVLGEGRNRHIRRLMSALDLRVLRLRRIRIGPLTETLLHHRPLLELPPSLLSPLLTP